MIRATRRDVSNLMGVGLGALLASGIAPGLLAQTQTRFSIGTAGRGGFFYPLGTGIAAAVSKYASGIEATPLVTASGGEYEAAS